MEKPSISDAWVSANSLITPERAHAVGLITLYWNFCEAGVRSLLVKYSGMNDVDGARFTFGMKTEAMATRIRSFLSYKEQDPAVVDRIECGLKAVDICRVNRNAIAHSWINFKGDKLFIEKVRTHPVTEVYDFNVTDLRRVADEIFSTGHYLMFVALYISSRQDPMWRQSLPEKPALPQRLQSIDQYGPEALLRPREASSE